MTILNKMIVATTETFIELGSAAFSGWHDLDLNAARLDVSLDTNGNGAINPSERNQAV